jgi:hypothetical protein
MTNFKKIAEKALKKANTTINEGSIYAGGLTEKMSSQLEEELKNGNHSLKDNPILPKSDDGLFEENIIRERFNDVCRRYKRSHDADIIDKKQVILNMMPMVHETMQLEKEHIKELEKLAIKMIREEYDIDENVVEINAKLTPNISLEGTKLNPSPVTLKEMDFNNHDDIINAGNEVHKRRFLNAMIQGAAKKCNNMFHMVDDELTKMNPKLPNRYSKMMSAADYMYYVIPNMENGVTGGVVKVDFPNKDNEKVVINAEAMVFPVLIHELVKGVMEILSSHGLPKNKKLAKYVINKADYLSAEPWDMRLGPALWERFTNNIEPDDFNIKHHIYSELVALPVNEFNYKMREILANTKEGKKIISELVSSIKDEFQQEQFNEAMKKIDNNNDFTDGWDINEIDGLF